MEKARDSFLSTERTAAASFWEGPIGVTPAVPARGPLLGRGGSEVTLESGLYPLLSALLAYFPHFSLAISPNIDHRENGSIEKKCQNDLIDNISRSDPFSAL
jgi:hypothetical protein